MNKIIVFDLGSVIFELKIDNIINSICNLLNQKMPENIVETIFKKSYFADFEKGNIDFNCFYNFICNDLNISIDKKNFISSWNSCLTRIVPGVEDFLFSIKNKASLYALSNTNEIHLKYLMSNFKIMTVFKKIYTSYQLKLRKPDLEIFKYVLKDLKIMSPQNILFIDDNPENIKSAKSLGITSHLCFESEVKLKNIVNTFLEC